MGSDLHCHTTFSDSDFTPEHVVETAVKAGLKRIAITDHDTCTGYEYLVPTLAQYEIEVVPGIEVSSQWGSREVHINGLWVDPNYEPLKQKTEEMRLGRIERIHKILDRLKPSNVHLDADEVLGIAGKGKSPGRVHIAQALMKAGYVSNMQAAFSKYIGDDSAAFVAKNFISSEDTIELIRASGGISVLCHPGTYFNEGFCVEFIKMGIDAVECFCPYYTPETSDKYLEMCAYYGAGVSGGADCHGDLKPDVKIGSIRVKEEYVEDLLERVENARA